MKFFSLFIIPITMSFWDCNKPREPAQPVSDKAAIMEVGALATIEWHLQKLIRDATWGLSK